jgi:hypothetical protein
MDSLSWVFPGSAPTWSPRCLASMARTVGSSLLPTASNAAAWHRGAEGRVDFGVNHSACLVGRG